MSEKKHPLEGYWLVRNAKRDSECDPFRSIMDLSPINAAKTGDYETDYLDFRSKAEEWVRENADIKGIERKNQNPVYFALMHGPIQKEPSPGNLTINIPVEQIPVGDLSFTLADSFDNYAKSIGKPSSFSPESTATEVFTAEEISTIFEKNGFPEDLFKAPNSGYIEVQLWNRELPALEKVKQQIRDSKEQIITLRPENSLSKALDDFMNKDWQPSDETKKLTTSDAPTSEEKQELKIRRPDLFNQSNGEELKR